MAVSFAASSMPGACVSPRKVECAMRSVWALSAASSYGRRWPNRLHQSEETPSR